ncbi:hypothetical protein [Microbacterium sp. P03]|uniref:hypothetical protein n=1 Tax=Microbacterium sp. P03 TaxID=3366946 RepID=UPI0037459D22
MVSDADARELAALRARAYGPTADIDADPSAQTRLRALEDARRQAAEDPPIGALSPDQDPVDGQVPVLSRPGASPSAEPILAETADIATSQDEASAPSGSHRRGRRVSLAVAVVAAVLVAFGAGQVVEQATRPQTAGWHTDLAAVPPRVAESYERVTETRRDWDADSLYFVGSVDARFVWLGTMQDGETTCVIVDADSQASDGFSGLACGPTSDVEKTSIGYATVSTESGTKIDQYSVDFRAGDAPVLLYSQTTPQ